MYFNCNANYVFPLYALCGRVSNSVSRLLKCQPSCSYKKKTDKNFDTHIVHVYRDYHVTSILTWNSAKRRMQIRIVMKWLIFFFQLSLMLYMRSIVLKQPMIALLNLILLLMVCCFIGILQCCHLKSEQIFSQV